AGLAFGLEARRFGQLAGPLEGLGAGRLGVPARVGVVARLLVGTHLEHGEHAAHLDRAPRAGAGPHRPGLLGQQHLHRAHVGHAALAHQHVVGCGALDACDQPAVVDADHGRYVVTHGVHRVVALVAVEGSVAFLVRDELDLTHLTHGDVG